MQRVLTKTRFGMGIPARCICGGRGGLSRRRGDITSLNEELMQSDRYLDAGLKRAAFFESDEGQRPSAFETICQSH